MGVSILTFDDQGKAIQKKREFKHRGFLRSRAEAKRKGRAHKQTRTAKQIIEAAEYH